MYPLLKGTYFGSLFVVDTLKNGTHWVGQSYCCHTMKHADWRKVITAIERTKPTPIFPNIQLLSLSRSGLGRDACNKQHSLVGTENTNISAILCDSFIQNEMLDDWSEGAV